MKLETLVAQVTANAPECPAYKINGYLLELLEKLRLEGARDIIAIDTSGFDPARNEIDIPDSVMHVHDVWLNGRRVNPNMREEDVVYINHATIDSRLLWADPYDDKLLTDYDGKFLEIL